MQRRLNGSRSCYRVETSGDPRNIRREYRFPDSPYGFEAAFAELLWPRYKRHCNSLTFSYLNLFDWSGLLVKIICGWKKLQNSINGPSLIRCSSATWSAATSLIGQASRCTMAAARWRTCSAGKSRNSSRLSDVILTAFCKYTKNMSYSGYNVQFPSTVSKRLYQIHQVNIMKLILPQKL